MRGGYQIVDFQGKTLTSSPTVIKGIWNVVSKSTKPLLLSNFVYDGTLYSGIWGVGTKLSATDYVFVLQIYTDGVIRLYIPSSDRVTISKVVFS